ncbi:hypothetical protein CEXT_516071 [Caerostris extrusa]|uniref:Uncharacterized protein n=1 Tax=Caerostris extrusa TaxID=172846 RepID=A0AAV4NM74_CAEEX|nr:hypothetical protein CEXT_516071 [Caerostris extrusa]
MEGAQLVECAKFPQPNPKRALSKSYTNQRELGAKKTIAVQGLLSNPASSRPGHKSDGGGTRRPMKFDVGPVSQTASWGPSNNSGVVPRATFALNQA